MMIAPNWTVALTTEAGEWLATPKLQFIAKSVVAAVRVAVDANPTTAEVSIVFTNDKRMVELNNRWRGKPQPTNVLSFPASRKEAMAGEAVQLGDIILGFETVTEEVADMGLTLPDHITHLLVHGLLHLLGHDHEDDSAAETMETLETNILATLGIANPYRGSESQLIPVGVIKR